MRAWVSISCAPLLALSAACRSISLGEANPPTFNSAMRFDSCARASCSAWMAAPAWPPPWIRPRRSGSPGWQSPGRASHARRDGRAPYRHSPISAADPHRLDPWLDGAHVAARSSKARGEGSSDGHSLGGTLQRHAVDVESARLTSSRPHPAIAAVAASCRPLFAAPGGAPLANGLRPGSFHRLGKAVECAR